MLLNDSGYVTRRRLLALLLILVTGVLIARRAPGSSVLDILLLALFALVAVSLAVRALRQPEIATGDAGRLGTAVLVFLVVGAVIAVLSAFLRIV